MANKYRLEVTFPFNDNFYELTCQLDKIAEKRNGKNVASGAGLGLRDVEYRFDDLKSAKTTRVEMEALDFITSCEILDDE